MDPVKSVRELQKSLAEGKNCKIAVSASERMQKALADAGVAGELDTGIHLIPKDVTRVLLAAICEVGTVVARAPFDGYGLGLKRKGDQLFLYFSKKTHTDTAEIPVKD